MDMSEDLVVRLEIDQIKKEEKMKLFKDSGHLNSTGRHGHYLKPTRVIKPIGMRKHISDMGHSLNSTGGIIQF